MYMYVDFKYYFGENYIHNNLQKICIEYRILNALQRMYLLIQGVYFSSTYNINIPKSNLKGKIDLFAKLQSKISFSLHICINLLKV